MKLKNNSTRTYIAGDYKIEAGQEIEVDNKEIAEILLKQQGIVEAISKEDLLNAVEENEKLKKELEFAKLKEEAIELGIKFQKNIGYEKLLEKVEDFKLKNI